MRLLFFSVVIFALAYLSLNSQASQRTFPRKLRLRVGEHEMFVSVYEVYRVQKFTRYDGKKEKQVEENQYSGFDTNSLDPTQKSCLEKQLTAAREIVSNLKSKTSVLSSKYELEDIHVTLYDETKGNAENKIGSANFLGGIHTGDFENVLDLNAYLHKDGECSIATQASVDALLKNPLFDEWLKRMPDKKSDVLSEDALEILEKMNLILKEFK